MIVTILLWLAVDRHLGTLRLKTLTRVPFSDSRIHQLLLPAQHPAKRMSLRAKFVLLRMCLHMHMTLKLTIRSLMTLLNSFPKSNPNINPALASSWQSLRPTFIPDRTPEEKADLERRADEHSSVLFDEINLHT
ncbi:hypothetical protein HID58_042475 [Brassica napus]|uniref:Uncharacterized protein n=1 Tax=Brassica napus TaxID=3708 RepID=A0ABQ8BDS4_BRANA|nr:hypothetical protein HID58_042475 [Brassica napus]